ncbi:UDP-glycosyltransferase 75C1-like [Solanum pennellii]|uniref:Glycosyltransferase n=1 Tax=Solanum pennellii TaxID=28526 RepID=A0ABM1FU51_SOLPN|nr:UDP-glycosyltransferase 75C1-like [Solanum pennellii]
MIFMFVLFHSIILIYLEKMASLNDDCHVLVVSFTGQGNLNPCIQFSKNLIKLGVNVTFSTSLTAFNRISNLPTIQGLTFAPFSDGYDGNFKGPMNRIHEFNTSLRTHGTEFVTNLVEDRAKQGCPFKRIIYTTLTAWIGLLAKKINVPSTFLWIQPASVLNIYYYFFNGYEDSIKNCSKDQSFELPGLPLLSRRDFPSILFNDSNDWTLLAMKEHVELLKSETNQKVLVNTFDALEFDALNVIENVTIFGIGPLIPSAFLDGNDSSDTSFGVDMRRSSDNYMNWLDSKAKESVIYIAFGSYSQIPNQLMEEIAHGLVLCKRPFLWIIREGANGEKPFEKLSCKEELEELGKTVDWCSQVEVLQHPSLACFLTHCGWNSSMESLASGVPVVACPLWIDQLSNAKLIQDVWKTGVRVNANDEGVIERNEFARCIEIVVGDGKKGEEIRKNAKKWRDLAKDAMKENGSSNVNLKAYVNEILLGE